MTPLARPGIPAISENLLELKYLSQEALSSGPSQKSFQMLVVSFTRAGTGLGSKVGPTVPFSNKRNTVCQKINNRNGCEWAGWCEDTLLPLVMVKLVSTLSGSLICSWMNLAHLLSSISWPLIVLFPSMHTLWMKRAISQAKKKGFGLCCIFGINQSTLTGIVAVWKRRPALRHRWRRWRRWRRPRRWRPVCWRTSLPQRPARTSGGGI